MPESKSTSKRPWAHQRGLQSEDCVIKYYQQQGYRLRAQRQKTAFAEVDLVFSGRDGEIVLVEVKSISHPDFVAYRLTRKQKQRLLRAQEYYLTRFNKVVLELAVVSQDGVVSIIPDIFC